VVVVVVVGTGGWWWWRVAYGWLVGFKTGSPNVAGEHENEYRFSAKTWIYSVLNTNNSHHFRIQFVLIYIIRTSVISHIAMMNNSS
jgi:hypothetical protein